MTKIIISLVIVEVIFGVSFYVMLGMFKCLKKEYLNEMSEKLDEIKEHLKEINK